MTDATSNVEALIDALVRFEQVLDAEHEALRARDMERVEALTAAKESAAAELETLQRALGPGFPAADLPAGTRRAELADALRRCHRKNQVNGAIAEAGVGVNRALIDILTGRSRHGTTYGGNGRVGGDGPGHALTRV